MGASFDASELLKLASVLESEAKSSKERASGVVKKGALNIKKQMQDEARPVQRGRVAAAISYDVTADGAGIVAEIGPEEGHAGSLAFFYYGNSKIGPQIPDPMGALEHEYPNLKSYLEKLIDL